MAQETDTRRQADPVGSVRPKRGYRMVRPSPKIRVSRRRFVRVIYAVGTILSLAAIAHVSYAFLSDAPYFKVAHVRIDGVSAPIQKELRDLSDKVLAENNNIINVNLDKLTKALGANPKITGLQLDKVYPDTLQIRATEREAAAIVSTEGFYLVDREGFVMEKLKPSLLRKYDFPYITGLPKDAVQVGEKIYNPRLGWALDLSRVLRERNSELYTRFSEIHIGTDPTHMDNLTALLKGGTEIRFGDVNPIDKLPALEFFLKKQQEQKIDPFAMAYIDLRFKDQIVFMDRPTALAEAAGVLGELQAEQAAELEKLKKKQQRQDEKNKSGSPVSKGSDGRRKDNTACEYNTDGVGTAYDMDAQDRSVQANRNHSQPTDSSSADPSSQQ